MRKIQRDLADVLNRASSIYPDRLRQELWGAIGTYCSEPGFAGGATRFKGLADAVKKLQLGEDPEKLNGKIIIIDGNEYELVKRDS